MKLNPIKIKKRIMKIGLDTGASHIASAMSMVNVLCDTYNMDNDALVIISKGHGVLAQYVILNELGKLPDEVLDTYYQEGGLSCHSTLMPEYGVYASTGSLGHGIGIGIGYAIANPSKLVFVILGDGELSCGSTLESMMIIQRLEIRNIRIVVDANGLDAAGEVKFYGDGRMLVLPYIPYYSTKGEGWGDEISGKVVSHYTTVTQEIYDTWKKNLPKIEKERERIKKEYLKQQKENEKNSRKTTNRAR